MASRVVTQLVSDLSGEEIVEGQGESIEFSYRGTSYTIDLTAQEAAGFDQAMAPYLEHATKQGQSSRRSTMGNVRRATPDTKAIRDWANQNGFVVGERGRIPAEVKDAYKAAGS